MSQILVAPCPRYIRNKYRTEINLGMAFCHSSPSLHQPILALGRSRLPAAFEVLSAFWNRQPPVVLRETVLLAMVMLRLPAATEFLIELVAAGPEAASLAALSALKIHAHDSRLRQRIAEVIQQRNTPALRARFEKDFH